MNNTLEIKIQDLKNLNKEEYLLVDIREEAYVCVFHNGIFIG